MLPEKYAWITREFEPEGDAWLLADIARHLEEDGNLEGAATVYDRAYGLAPAAEQIRLGRQQVLDRLAVVEHGLRFRYIPEGVFLMGCDTSEADECPWHPVWLSAYWLSETPLSWADYCRLLGWDAPPVGLPSNQDVPEEVRFGLFNTNKIRLQYCEDQTTRATSWHNHVPPDLWQSWGNSLTHHRPPPRANPEAPWTYDAKPMVAVSWQEAVRLGEHLSNDRIRYSLPTEAQWEKGARGGLIGARHAWGNEPPTPERCDCDRFEELSIRPMKTFPPNGYGLYAVNGGVWEWVQDWYDRDYYRQSPESNPEGPAAGQEKVLRGGSWADCADVVTVTFRMTRKASDPGERGWGTHLSPNIGFRLCRFRPPLAPG